MKSETITTSECQLLHCHLLEPFGFGNKYSVRIAVDKSDVEMLDRMRESAGGDSALNDLLRDDGQIFSFRASTSIKPLLVDSVLRPTTDIYSGCYGRVSFKLLPYHTPNGDGGVYARLDSVKKTRDGERLDGRDLSCFKM